jgi:hypothetical protein
VIAAWHKQMKERKLDGDKLLADVHVLLAKYAEEPEPEPPQAPRPVEQPAEQQAVTEPPQTAEPRSHGFRRPRADAPAVEAAAPPTSAQQPSSMPPWATPSPSAPPAAKPAPAPVAAPKLKELDIPL